MSGIILPGAPEFSEYLKSNLGNSLALEPPVLAKDHRNYDVTRQTLIVDGKIFGVYIIHTPYNCLATSSARSYFGKLPNYRAHRDEPDELVRLALRLLGTNFKDLTVLAFQKKDGVLQRTDAHTEITFP